MKAAKSFSDDIESSILSGNFILSLDDFRYTATLNVNNVEVEVWVANSTDDTYIYRVKVNSHFVYLPEIQMSEPVKVRSIILERFNKMQRKITTND